MAWLNRPIIVVQQWFNRRQRCSVKTETGFGATRLDLARARVDGGTSNSSVCQERVRLPGTDCLRGAFSFRIRLRSVGVGAGSAGCFDAPPHAAHEGVQFRLIDRLQNPQQRRQHFGSQSSAPGQSLARKIANSADRLQARRKASG